MKRKVISRVLSAILITSALLTLTIKYDFHLATVKGWCEDNIDNVEYYVYADANGQRYYIDMEKYGDYVGDKVLIVTSNGSFKDVKFIGRLSIDNLGFERVAR